MVPILNMMAVDVSVFGNHDFDFGVDVLEDLASKNTFPWLMRYGIYRQKTVLEADTHPSRFKHPSTFPSYCLVNGNV